MSDETRFESWLKGYGRAWETGDAEAAGALFSQEARYYETPFDEPLQGRAAVIDYWSDVPRLQEGITFRYEILADGGGRGVARWWAAFTRRATQSRVRLDGILLAEFDEAGLCLVFREWWHRQEEQAG
jgi:ketosteroid isomerase-like protein